ncbi:uncharacterized protein LOC114319196 [Camellia sinensis]|uniref:uncharacterized protein LOC114319196 n=1 Tax=Camellia sinensis TaxID=4442 RepID=UPI0010367AD9|nr:uncharacterized protein LOC114319196 [Camellia sinensis]
MAPYEALYGWPCQSLICWTEVEEAPLLGPELVQETTEKKERKVLTSLHWAFRNFGQNRRSGVSLALPPQLAGVHNVFHVSMLRKYEPHPSHIINWEEINLDEDVTFEEKPVKILDRREKKLRGKTILLIRVL